MTAELGTVVWKRQDTKEDLCRAVCDEVLR